MGIIYREAVENAEAKERTGKVRKATVFCWLFLVNRGPCSSKLRARRNKRRRTSRDWPRSELNERQLRRNARQKQKVRCGLFSRC